MSLGAQGALNRIAGTSGLAEQGAANAAASRIDRLEESASQFKPTGAIAQTFSRAGATMANGSLLTSGRLHLTAINIPIGRTITTASFMSAVTALSGGTNQWFALFNSSRVLLRQTADDTSTAWAGSTLKTLTLTTPYVTTYSGLHYLGIMVAAATPPTIQSISSLSPTLGVAPIVNGFADTGLTTTAPSTATALTATGTYPWAFVS